MSVTGFMGITDTSSGQNIIIAIPRIISIEPNGPDGCVMRYDSGLGKPRLFTLDFSVEAFMEGLLRGSAAAMRLQMDMAEEEETQQ
jgi:hypothetical protein